MCSRGQHRLISVEPEVVFRIVRVALDDGSPRTDASPPPSYREQAFEIALRANSIFQNDRVVGLTRRVPVDRVINAVPPSCRRRAHRPRTPEPVGPPRIGKTLRKAIEWRRQLDGGEVANQAAIARREGISRARVTRVLMLLRLAPEIKQRMLHMSETPIRRASWKPI